MKTTTRLVITALATAIALPLVAQAADKKKNDGPAAFAKMDKDQDGKISESEFVASAKDKDQAKTRFASLDKDQSGDLTKQEMAAGAKKGGGKKKNK